jgi:uncharacterized protein YifE (UPF0438 family)
MKDDLVTASAVPTNPDRCRPGDRSELMSTVPPDHLEHLRKRPFALGCSAEVFPADELAALAEFGNWLEALASGAIRPVTPEHERFLRVDRGEAEPATVCERAWVRLTGRREFEREQRAADPPPPPADYGIVEWDADRCWW